MRALPCFASPRLSLLAPLALAACAAPPGKAPTRPPARALFDGVSLAGWEGDARYWRVEDGALVGESTAANPCAATTYLAWRGGEVGDFELELEWRLGGGNSGVQFRSRAAGPTAVAGYQADLEAGPDWTGGLYEQDGRGVVTRRGERVVLDAQGQRSVERFADGAALLGRVDAAGWNRMRVTAFGPRLTIEINDVLFSETIDLDPARAARRGTFALQLHQGPPMKVEFRRIELRELGGPAAPALEAARDPWDVPDHPQWIWSTGDVADQQSVWFLRDFTLPSAPRRAELWISCDNAFTAWLNGAGVAAGDDWMEPTRLAVEAALTAGENQLLVRGTNEGSAAGLILRLAVECVGGERVVVVSDGSFQACLNTGAAPLGGDGLGDWLAHADWEAARTQGGLEAAPWSAVRGLPAAPTFAPAGDSITVPPGFRVELLHSVDGAREGSWVSLAVDPRGRLYASDQYGGLFRIQVPPAGEREGTRVEPLAVDLGEAHGLLWAFDALYAVVSAGGEHESGLYRLRDTDGDDALDAVELLRRFEGDGEHGPHGVVLAPDGRSLFVVGGNHTKLPGPFVRSRVPTHWGEDVLLPPYDDPNGHAVGITAPGGWVVRTDPDGREWELYAAGFRNAYDLAFSPEGELFTYDSDMEWDVGLPWYRPTRILHVVSGADFGWRTGSAKWPADSCDSLPAAVDLGLASPTGIVFGTHTNFPAPWRGALFASDWAYGKIHAVFLEPEGASFGGRHELFAGGEPFPVTDLVVGRDGALYVTIGGRRAQSGLYRIAWEGPAGEARVPPAAGAAARAERAALEGLHAGEGTDPGPALARLGSADRFLRHAARIGLEHLDPALWRAAVRAEEDPRAALAGWLALVRSDPACDAHELVARALGLFAAADERELRLDALRLLELAQIRLGLGESERARIRAQLEPAYPSGDARLDRALLAQLVAVGGDVAGRALAQLDGADDQEQRIALLYALRALHTGWREADGRRFLGALERELEAARGGASVRGYLEKMRAEALESLGELAATMPAGSPASLGAVSGLDLRARAGHAWSMAELEPALGEVARGRTFARGRDAYLAASCHSCHRLAGEGENLGPDLTGAAGRYSARDLLLAILEPSREVPDVWRDTELWGTDRLLAVGRLESEHADELVVLETAGTRARLDPAAVVERNPHRLSRMPEGLLERLTRAEILDLLAYVLAGGDELDQRFR